MNRARILKKVTTRIYLLLAVFFFLGAGVVVKLVDLQIAQGSSLREKARTQYQRIKEVTPGRGNIYDRSGRKLALSVSVESVAAVPMNIDDEEGTARVLSSILGKPVSQLQSKLDSERHFTWLQRKADDRTVERIRSLNLEGIVFRRESRRVYPWNDLAGQILGFSGLDNQGLGGVEASLDRFLRGHPGRVLRERDCLGRSFVPAERVLQDPLGGNDVYLTIDQVIQHIAEKQLRYGIERENAKGGTVIVMDVQTGEILAMAIAPSFDPNLYSNRILTSYPVLSETSGATNSLEPGSTVKSLVIAAAVDLGIVSPETRIDCLNGKISVAGHTFTDWKPFGVLSVSEILKNSSDVGSIRIGMRVGREQLERYFRAFGLAAKTGIELCGEDRGRLPEYWSRTSIAAVSFGYEIMVTPVQLITAFSSFGTDGNLMKPRILKKVCRADGSVILETGPKRVRQVVKPSTAKTMVSMLENVVTEGTGMKAAVPGVPIAGKTGTVEIFDSVTGSYHDNLNRALFIGFFPSRGVPETAILVIIEAPKFNTFGGSAAAPVFSKIAKEIIHYRRSQHPAESRQKINLDRLLTLSAGDRSSHVL